MFKVRQNTLTRVFLKNGKGPCPVPSSDNVLPSSCYSRFAISSQKEGQTWPLYVSPRDPAHPVGEGDMMRGFKCML